MVVEAVASRKESPRSETVQAEVESGGLVNLYWIGRVNDATVRHDRDVLAYLDETPDIWLTTWGEAWSSWSGKRCYEHDRDVAEIDGRTVLTFESLETEACRSVSNDLPWNIPLTWLIDVEGVEVLDVVSVNSNRSLASIEGEKTLSKDGGSRTTAPLCCRSSTVTRSTSR